MNKVFVKTQGCSANFAEGEIIEGQLQKAKFSLVKEPGLADVILLNICTVKGDTTALRAIGKLKEKFPNKKFVITGCITPEIVEPIRELVPKATLINTHNIDQIVHAVKNALKSKPIEKLEPAKLVKLMFPRKRKNPVIGIIPISSGCLDMCGYCSTRLVKGVLHSYQPEKIIEEIKLAVKEGCKEIWITAQDTGCYGFDIKTNLAELLKQVVEIPGDFMLRLGMGNPRHMTKYLDELVEVFKNPKLFKFLHIPVQSGNNDVLKAMRRGHDVETFKKIVAAFRKKIPEITVSTDIIVGYPGETKQEFVDSVNLIKEIKPGVLNISRFVPRPGTYAATLPDDVSKCEKKDRSGLLRKAFDKVAFEENQKWLGWKGEILIDEHGHTGTMIGRNFAYKPVAVQGEFKLGDKIPVEIIKARSTYFVGHH